MEVYRDPTIKLSEKVIDMSQNLYIKDDIYQTQISVIWSNKVAQNHL